MNVLFLTSWYPTADFTYGGVFVREHAKAVRDAGHRVVVVHLAGPTSQLGRDLWAMEEELDPTLTEGIETHHVSHRGVPVRGGSYPLYLWSALAAYRRLRASGFRPDVIHAHVYGAGVPAAIIARRARVPLVITEQFTGFPRRTLSRAEARKARYAYRRAARALPVSRHLQEAIRSYGISGSFEVVPNVVDTLLFFAPGPERTSSAEHRLLFVGNLEPSQHKGFPTLLSALADLRARRSDWRLDVIGDGPEKTNYEKSSAELGLRELVTFHGSRPKSAIAEAMREADLFVLPSRFDNLPCVVVEALGSGLPVVSTTVGGIPELVDETSGRLVPPNDAAALADALDDVLATLEIFDRAAISAAARDRYSLGVVGEQLGRIYESVLAESPDAARDARRR
ncbi:MAG TPA: glycosyltransferase [Gaiellaceae bacterium]|nr:glycosyltransferase [Gaiellaceae bacterium]